MASLSGQVAIVAGATRGAGRGIARQLGAAGAVVYCTGRGSTATPSRDGYWAGRPETIEATAQLVDAAGGTGIPVRVDHRDEAAVAALMERVEREQHRLDLLVNVFWAGPSVTQWGSFWTHPLEHGRALMDVAWPHIITSRYAAALMIPSGATSGLIIQLTEGDGLYYRQNLFYDLGRLAEIRLAYALGEELAPHGITALALTPGYMRTEAMLDGLGVTEANWRDAVARDPHFVASETPSFIGRVVVALASDPRVSRKSGGLYSSWRLGEEYGVSDDDGSRPNLGRHFAAQPGGAPWLVSRTPTRWETTRASG